MAFDLVHYFAEQIRIQKPALPEQYPVTYEHLNAYIENKYSMFR